MSVVLRDVTTTISKTIDQVTHQEIEKSTLPDAMKSEIEKIVKEVVAEALKKLVSMNSGIDKNGDGVVSLSEVKEVVVAQAQQMKLNCCRIS